MKARGEGRKSQGWEKSSTKLLYLKGLFKIGNYRGGVVDQDTPVKMD